MSRSVPRALLLMVRRTPVLPAALLDQLLAAGPALHPTVLAALLRRTDVPLAALEPLCRSTGDLPPQAAAAYVGRPEHSSETITALLDADPRPELIDMLVSASRSHGTALTVALPRCTPRQLQRLVMNSGAPDPIRGTALARLADLAATAEPPARRERFESAQGQLEEVLEDLKGPLANAAAPHSSDPSLLAACVPYVSDPAAADHIAHTWLAPLLTAGPLPPDKANSIVSAAYRLGRVSSPATRAAMAGWMEATTLADPGSLGPGYNLRDLVVQLRDGELLDRRWSAAVFDDQLYDPRVDVAQLVAAELGDDPARWAVYVRLAEEFTGTIAELLDTVRAVAAQ